MRESLTQRLPRSWPAAWPDALAFATGLGLAWHLQWKTSDLIWSLWLSSLLVGYAMIVWGSLTPTLLLWRERRLGAATLATLGGVFTLAFFTVHFGMFHFVHSAFLQSYFPVLGDATRGHWPGWDLYREVLVRYGWFVPAVLVAERSAFQLDPLPPEPPRTSVRAADIAARKQRQASLSPGATTFRPYLNVVRLHLLIFFFAGVRKVGLEDFPIYAVVYAAYFFPWRILLNRSNPVEASASS